jgi:uncharacterized protein (DUF2141 family)
MKKTLTHTPPMLALALCGLAFGAQAADLTVEVDGALAKGGSVTVGLFDAAAAATFPKTPSAGQRTAAAQGPVTVVFRNLQPGRYAISAYHDQNDNQVLDRGAFGIPKERYGFSQDARGAGGPPEFRDAAFEVKDGGDNRVKLTLR